jgi:hypothetical protein
MVTFPSNKIFALRFNALLNEEASELELTLAPSYTLVVF